MSSSIDADLDRRQATLVAALRDPRCYDHAVRAVRVVETHISRIVLTGCRAYKLKKPVSLGFLDFSTIQARRFFCEEEVRLNRRLAPELYLGVVGIGGTPDAPRVGPAQPVLDYAVVMREFAASSLLSERLERGRPALDEVDAIAERVAAFHEAAPRAADGAPYGRPRAIVDAFSENLRQLDPLLSDGAERSRFDVLARWLTDAGARLSDTFAARRAAGRVRECHGDLHAGNVARLDGRPCVFDCLEFSPELRWLDVADEVAFLAMDLECRGHAELAWRFLNDWLSTTGDYGAMAVIDAYRVHRALVRAKVARIRAVQRRRPTRRSAEAGHYLDVALRIARGGRPHVIAMHGLSGSGKTTLARRLGTALPAVLVRSDVERKRLSGLGPLDRASGAAARALYSAATSDRTLEAMSDIAGSTLAAGHAVVVDAASLSRGWRDRLRSTARTHGVPYTIVSCRAPRAVLLERVEGRTARSDDASDADVEVLRRQIETAGPLDEDELCDAIRVDTADADLDGALPGVVESLRAIDAASAHTDEAHE